MVYNNGLRFTEEELGLLESADEIQYVGVQMSRPGPHCREIASRLARADKKIILQIWWGPEPPHSWSRFSMANIAMDSKLREDFFREVVDPLIDSIGPENIHSAHMLEETAICFATDMLEPGEPENLLDGTGGVYDSPFYSGYSGRDSYGGPWMLSLRRHNEDFKRFSGYDLFEASIWKGPEWRAFRRWVGQRVQAQANNRFADHLHDKYPNILATTWDGPNFGGTTWADTPAMLNSIDGFTANAYSSPLRTYMYARNLKTLDYDKELEFMSWVGRNNLDVNARRTMLTSVYACGSNIVHLWEEPRRCYQRDDLWTIMSSQYGALSKLPVFRHTPQVLLVSSRWEVPSPYLKSFDVVHSYDAEGVALGRYKFVLTFSADHPGLGPYVEAGGLAMVYESWPTFLHKEGILVPDDNPPEFAGRLTPDTWWRDNFDLAESYALEFESLPGSRAREDVHTAQGIAYQVSYGDGEILVLPGKPTDAGRDKDWALFVYDLMRSLLRRGGREDVFQKHFSSRDSGGRYLEMSSDDGSVTCCFYYGVGQNGPALLVKGRDLFTGEENPSLGPERSSSIVMHVPTVPWASPPSSDRTRLVKPAPEDARRGLPELPELPPMHSLGPAAVALKPGCSPQWSSKPGFEDWAVTQCSYRLVIHFNTASAALAGQPFVLTGKDFYGLTGLAKLNWRSVRLFQGENEAPVQVDERDNTGHYVHTGNGQLDLDDELVFLVNLPTGLSSTYHLYYGTAPSGGPDWPHAPIEFQEVETATADAVITNGRLEAHLKGPAKQPGVNRLDSHGAGALTGCLLDGKAFTRIHHNWGNYFFANRWSGEGGWTDPELVISGPLRFIARTHLPSFTREDENGNLTFQGCVTNNFSLYYPAPVLDIEQCAEYEWSDRTQRADYTFYATVGSGLDPKDLLFVPVAGSPRRVPLTDDPYAQVYRERGPEQGWMALVDPVERHGCALFYARMPAIRENLAWVDYAPRRELTPSVKIHPDGYPMTLRYTNRVMQTDDVVRHSFRIVGLTEEDEKAVAAQYTVWGEDLTRIAELEVQKRESPVLQKQDSVSETK